MIAESSRVTQETKRKQSNAFQILRENDLLPRILHPDKLPVKTDDKIKTFPDIQFCQAFISSAFFLRKLLKGVFHQNEGVNQEKGSHGIPEPGAPREKEGEGKWRRGIQDDECTQAWRAANPDQGRGWRLRKYKKNGPSDGLAQPTTLLRGTSDPAGDRDEPQWVQGKTSKQSNLLL